MSGGDLFNSGWDNIFNPLSPTVLGARASGTGTTSVAREKELKQRRAEALVGQMGKQKRAAEKREKQRIADIRSRDDEIRTKLRESTGGYASNILTGGSGIGSGTGAAARMLYEA